MHDAGGRGAGKNAHHQHSSALVICLLAATSPATYLELAV